MKDMFRRVLAVAVMVASGTMLFAEGDDYASLLAKAKDYEAKKQYVHALGSYWDAMEASPEKAVDALDAYNKLAGTVKAGNPGYGEFSGSDLLNGWIAMYADYESYWKENSMYVFSVSSLKKDKLDVVSGIATYSTSVRASKSKKYNEIKDVVQTGNRRSRQNDWQDVPFDFDEAIASKVPSRADYAVQLGIADKDGTILVSGTPTNLSKSYSSTDYVFPGIDRATMQVLDAGDVRAVPVSISCKGNGLSLDFVKWAVRGMMSTDIYAADSVSLAKACADCVGFGRFYMMRTEMTQAQYRAVTGLNPSAIIGNNRPVERVSWYDAIEFCNRLSVLKGLTPCYSVKGSTDVDTWGRGGNDYRVDDVKWDRNANGWRLPTEGEWKKAAADDADKVSWYNSNTNETHEVATKNPNANGMYDMKDNVWEWCWDPYSVYVFVGSLRLMRVQRGRCAVSYQGNTRHPDSRSEYIGFRLVRSSN